jgi:hypothetical protein
MFVALEIANDGQVRAEGETSHDDFPQTRTPPFRSVCFGLCVARAWDLCSASHKTT